MAIGKVIGTIGAGIAKAVASNASKNKTPKVTYDKDADYQALINQAIQSGNTEQARGYEAQRNAKISDLNATGTNTGGYQSTSYYQPINLPEYKPYSGKLPELNLPSLNLPTLELPDYEKFTYKDFDYRDFNYDDFKYNVNDDKMYNVYKDMYGRQGQAASDKALANTAAATGGMPSSYAAAANAQAQQAYAKKTADMIPILEDKAYNRFANERGFAYGQYSDDRNFNYQDYLGDRDLAHNEHQNDYQAGYGKALDLYGADYNSTIDKYNADYSKSSDMYNADWQNVNFNYQDNLNKYNADVDRTKSTYNSEIGQRDFNYQNYLNQEDNRYREDTFDWQKGTDERNYNRDVLESDRNYNYNSGQDAIRNSISWANQGLSKEKFEYDKQQDELARQYEESERLKQDIINSPEVYPNTPYGQEKYIADKEANAREDGIIRDFIAEAFKAEDTNRYLGENLKDLSPSQAEAVVAYFESLKKAKY